VGGKDHNRLPGPTHQEEDCQAYTMAITKSPPHVLLVIILPSSVVCAYMVSICRGQGMNSNKLLHFIITCCSIDGVLK